MPYRRLLDESIVVYSDVEIAQYVNDETGSSFESIVDAINNLGLSAVGLIPVAVWQPKILAALAVGMATQNVIDSISEYLNSSSLTNTVSQMNRGDFLEVTTRIYEWSSQSGNHYTRVTEVSYDVVTYIIS